MRFLVDNALSPVLATLLEQAGHDALHVRAIDLHRSDDVVIFDRAAAEDRIVVSADTDFGALLATRAAQKPSVIQFRGRGSRKPEALAHVIVSNLPQLIDALQSGSIVTFEPSRVRVRGLPINTALTDEDLAVRRWTPRVSSSLPSAGLNGLTATGITRVSRSQP